KSRLNRQKRLAPASHSLMNIRLQRSERAMAGQSRGTINILRAVCFAILLVSGRTIFADRIDETTFVQLGGLDQWISIRGDDRINPVLLVVHGGPGETQWPNLEKYRPWQKSFTVAPWDQSGPRH